jgi:hypothetical protein
VTTAKRIFLRKEPGKQSLAEWWVSVVHDDRFEMVMTCARAECMELSLSQEQMRGAEMMLATLLTLPDSEEVFTELPGPGLVHRMPVKGEPEKKD